MTAARKSAFRLSAWVATASVLTIASCTKGSSTVQPAPTVSQEPAAAIEATSVFQLQSSGVKSVSADSSSPAIPSMLRSSDSR
jgi:hypothetical protein